MTKKHGMEPAALDAWIAKLREPGLEQCHGLLQAYEDEFLPAYCCLGVYDFTQGYIYADHDYGYDDVEASRTYSESGLSNMTQDILAYFNDKGSEEDPWDFPRIADLLQDQRDSLIACGCFSEEWLEAHRKGGLGHLSVSDALRERDLITLGHLRYLEPLTPGQDQP